MARIEFTSHLAKHVDCPSKVVDATTLGEALTIVFEQNPQARGYILDDQGAIRKHVAVFIDSQMVCDRNNLDVPITPQSEIFVMQALSGG